MLGTVVANLGGVISKGQCCDLENFSRTRLSFVVLGYPYWCKSLTDRNSKKNPFINRICNILSDRIIFKVSDEADISGCQYVNTLVVDIEQPVTTYLLDSKILDALPNQQTVTQTIDATR